MQLIMVHGWSVTHTDTYGDLPNTLTKLASSNNLTIDLQHIHLGKYISFNDQVTMDDVATALDFALREILGSGSNIKTFSCITHSTGGPVVRYWLNKYYPASNKLQTPLKHLIMLAPANHGSSLAALGKHQVGRIKSWFSGVEPGLKILDWLCLGSNGQAELNNHTLNYSYLNNNCFPFVLTGQGIDSKFYDFINNYLVEDGSDGVIRVAAANMNYFSMKFKQTKLKTPGKFSKNYYLQSKTKKLVSKPAEVAMGVFSDLSHSGNKMGILASREKYSRHQKLANEIINCLKVNNKNSYQLRKEELSILTKTQQSLVPLGKKQIINRYCLLVFMIHDQYGEVIDKDDFDLVLIAGSKFSAGILPKGFFKDRQINAISNHLVFYLDADKLLGMKDNILGFKITARPDSGFCYFNTVEFRDETIKIDSWIAANTTTYIDVELTREVDKNVFRFSSAANKREDFKRIKPSGESIID
jgi:hypothetical protein